MKEKNNINSVTREELIFSARNRKFKELRDLVESGKGSIEEGIRFRILQDRIRDFKVKRD
ncbi:MAG: hypothetical protein PHN66_02045 [Candidatus Shapirobacteria bacterium]|jgi:hypothetical protein|nr:hypothetical protein [Candidatus Shapirobacteria bacterium]